MFNVSTASLKAGKKVETRRRCTTLIFTIPAINQSIVKPLQDGTSTFMGFAQSDGLTGCYRSAPPPQMSIPPLWVVSPTKNHLHRSGRRRRAGGSQVWALPPGWTGQSGSSRSPEHLHTHPHHHIIAAPTRALDNIKKESNWSPEFRHEWKILPEENKPHIYLCSKSDLEYFSEGIKKSFAS